MNQENLHSTFNLQPSGTAGAGGGVAGRANR
jgi:hypothetical protein